MNVRAPAKPPNATDDESCVNIILDPERTDEEKHKAITIIYDRYIILLTKYAENRLGGAKAYAEDIAHDKLVDVLTGLENGTHKFEDRGNDSLKRWLFTCTRNAVLNWLEKYGSSRLTSFEEQPDLQEEQSNYGPKSREQEALRRQSRKHYEDEEGKTHYTILCEQLIQESKLNAIEAIVMHLHLLFDLRPRDMQDVLGLDTAKISRILYKAKQKIQEKLDRDIR